MPLYCWLLPKWGRCGCQGRNFEFMGHCQNDFIELIHQMAQLNERQVWPFRLVMILQIPLLRLLPGAIHFKALFYYINIIITFSGFLFCQANTSKFWISKCRTELLDSQLWYGQNKTFSGLYLLGSLQHGWTGSHNHITTGMIDGFVVWNCWLQFRFAQFTQLHLNLGILHWVV